MRRKKRRDDAVEAAVAVTASAVKSTTADAEAVAEGTDSATGASEVEAAAVCSASPKTDPARRMGYENKRKSRQKSAYDPQ